LGGGTLGHLVATANTDGTSAQTSAARHIWEEDIQNYWTYTSVQQALTKQIISVCEPMYLKILNDNMLGYANISARDMLYHLFETYINITAVGLEINFEYMVRAWDPQQQVESLFKLIRDCVNFSEAGGRPHWPPTTNQCWLCLKIVTGHFMSACHRWNEKHTIGQTWNQFKPNFAAAHRQHKQMQVESAATAGYHSANAAVAQNEYQMTEAAIGSLANLVTAAAVDRGVVAALT
jgi:hypothetical protein